MKDEIMKRFATASLIITAIAVSGCGGGDEEDIPPPDGGAPPEQAETDRLAAEQAEQDRLATEAKRAAAAARGGGDAAALHVDAARDRAAGGDPARGGLWLVVAAALAPVDCRSSRPHAHRHAIDSG